MNSESSSNDPQAAIAAESLPSIDAKESWFAKYFHANVLKVIWSLIVFLGGLIALIFFVHIDFLPTIDLPNATAILASIALIGILIVYMFGVIITFPSFVLQSFAEGRWKKHDEATIKEHEEKTDNKIKQDGVNHGPANPVVYGDGNGTNREPNASLTKEHTRPSEVDKERRHLIFASIIAVMLAAALHVGLVRLQVQSQICPNYVYLPMLFAILFIGAPAFWFSQTKKWGAKGVKLANAVWLFAFWVTVGLFQLLPFLWTIIPTVAEFDFYFSLAFWLIVVGLLNTLGLMPNKVFNWRVTIPLAVLSFFMLLMLNSNVAWLSTAAFKALALGAVDDVQIVVTAEGCDVIRAALKQAECGQKTPNGHFSVEHVQMKSRVGAEYLFEFGIPAKADRVVLKKDYVIGWSRRLIPKTHPGKTCI